MQNYLKKRWVRAALLVLAIRESAVDAGSFEAAIADEMEDAFIVLFKTAWVNTPVDIPACRAACKSYEALLLFVKSISGYTNPYNEGAAERYLKIEKNRVARMRGLVKRGSNNMKTTENNK